MSTDHRCTAEPGRPCPCTADRRPVATAVVRLRPRWRPAPSAPPSPR